MKTLVICGWGVCETIWLGIFLWFAKKKEWFGVIEKRIKWMLAAGMGIMAGISGAFVFESAASKLDMIKVFLAFAGLSAAAIVDYKVKLIPNLIVGIMLCTRVVLLIPEFILRREEFAKILGNSVLSAVIVFAILFILSVVSKNGIGMGDVKILTALGFLTSLYSVLNTMIGALVLCVLMSMALILAKKKKMKDKIPFGPFLFLGYCAALVLGAY